MEVANSAQNDWNANAKSFLIKADHAGPSLRLLYRKYSILLSGVLDAAATHCLYVRIPSATNASEGIILRDLRDKSAALRIFNARNESHQQRAIKQSAFDGVRAIRLIETQAEHSHWISFMGSARPTLAIGPYALSHFNFSTVVFRLIWKCERSLSDSGMTGVTPRPQKHFDHFGLKDSASKIGKSCVCSESS